MTVLFLVTKPAGCGVGLKVPLKHMPLGDTDHPGDYSLSGDTVSIERDGTSSFGVRIVDDDIPEPDELFLVFFGDMPAGLTAAKPDTMRVAINDDDSPEPGRVQNLRASPGDTEVTLEWDPPIHGNPPDSYEFSYWEGDGGPVHEWATVAGGGSARSVTVTGLNNGNEHTFGVRAENEHGPGQPEHVSATPQVAVNIADETVGEGDGTVTLTVSLRTSQTKDVTVAYSTADGTATAGEDYTAVTNGSLMIAGGATSGEITISITDDDDDDDDETFTVTLSDPVNATIGNGTATVTITDNDEPAPNSPQNLSATAGDREVTLAWDPPGSGSTPTGYGYRYKEGSGAFGDSTAVAGGASARSVTVTGLANGTEHTFEVWAVNSTGAGSAASATATPIPTVSIADATVGEADGTATLTVTLSASSAQDVTVSYNTADGTATANEDYTAVTNETVAVTAGTTSAEISIGITDDDVDDDAETFTVVLSGPANATIGTATATVTITDNDELGGAPQNLSAAAGDREVTLTWEPPGSGGAPVEYGYRYKVGTGAFGDSTTVAGGASARSVTVTGLANGTEHTFEVWARSAAGPGPAASAPATPISSVSIADATVGEGDGTATLTVTLSASSTRDVTVSYNTADGTATAGADYTAVSNGMATITAGATSTDITIAITDDTADDDGETFTVTLSNAANATIGTATATVAITDNDELAGAPQNLAATPGDGEVTLLWAPPSSGDAPVEYWYRYKVGSGAFGNSTVVAGGGSARNVTVTGLANGTEHTFEVWARSAAGPGPAASAPATPISSVSIADATVGEGDGTATLTVTLSASSTRDVTVSYNTADGTATAGADYTAVSNGMATITAGATSTDITIAITDDTADDDGETFTVTLSNAANATIGTATATVAITDNDELAGAPQNLAATPGDGEVTLLWAPPSSGDAPVEYWYRYKVGSGAFGNSTVVAGGGSARNVTVTGLANGTEHTFEVWARSAAGPGPAASAPATPISSVSIADATVGEGDGTATLTVTLSASSTRDVTVSYNTADGTATAGADYTAVSNGMATITAGATSTDITIAITDDTADDDGETFTVTLSNAANATIGTATATVAITDNDELAGAPQNLAATPGDGEVTLLWAPPSSGDAPVEYWYRYKVGSGAFGNSTVVAGGGSARNVTVTGLANGTEHTFEVWARSAAGPGPAASAPATPISSVSIADATVGEGDGTATLTVTLSASSTRDVTVSYNTADGTATAGSDYTAIANGSATITAGNTSTDITISITDDTEDDDAETFIVTLGSADNATIGTATATVTITDNDDPVPGTPENLAATPGDKEVMLEWDPPTTGGDPESYEYRYQAGSDPFTEWKAVPGGASATDVMVMELANSIGHNFEVAARNPTGAGPPAAIIALPVSANTSALSIANATVDEDIGTLELTVKLDPVSTQQVTIDYATADGTATVAGADYTAGTGTLTFAVGEVAQIISVPVNDDDVDEDDETFTVTLTNATGGAAIGVPTATIVIRDNDNSPPGPPQGLTAEPEEGRVVLEWSPPASNAGAPVTGYQYRFAADSDPFVDRWTNLPGAAGARQVTISGLTNGTRYRFQVRAENKVGFGVPATASATPELDPFVVVRPRRLVVEEGTGEEYTVVLGTEPRGTVTIRMTTDLMGTHLSAVPLELEFTRSNWDVPQRILVESPLDDDEEDEPEIELTHDASGGGYNGVAVDSVLVEVRDNGLPFIRGQNASADEEDPDGMVFDVYLSFPVDFEVTVDYTTVDGTAVAGRDYTSTTGTLTFPPGTTEAAVTVPLLNDSEDERNESFTLEVYNPVDGIIDNPGERLELTGTIVDADVPEVTISFARSTYTVAEGGRVRLELNLSGDPGRTAEVGIAVTKGLGVLDSDFFVPRTVVFRAGDRRKVVEFHASADRIDEDDEVVVLEIAPDLPDGFLPGRRIRIQVTITDDDQRGIEVSETALEIAEGSAASYVITLTSEPTSAVTVSVTTNLSGTDLTVSPSTLLFTPANWGRPQTIVVSTARDSDSMQDPVVVLRHRASGADYEGVPVADVSVQVLEDDRATMTVSDAEANEGDGSLVFKVTLDHSSVLEVSAMYTTVTGTAIEGMDFVPAQGTVVFPPGRKTAQVVVGLIDDRIDEETESFTLSFSDFVNASQVGGPLTATGTILDDDLPSVSIEALAESVPEGTPARFRLTRVSRLGTSLTVPVTVSETGDFLAGAAPTSVTFAANSVEATLSLLTADDALDEMDGTIEVTMGEGNEYVITGSRTARMLVSDNDAMPAVRIGGGRVEEDAGEILLPVSLRGASAYVVSVAWATADMTARAGTDYQASSGRVTFGPGETEATVRVAVRNDLVPEEDETFTVTLSSPTNAVLDQEASATAVIVDDDANLAKAWLARFGRTVASQAVEGITERLDGSLGGESLSSLTGEAANSMRNGRALSFGDLVDGTAVQLSSGLGGFFEDGTLTTWLRGVNTSFSGAEDDQSVDGSVLTALAGVDYERGSVLAGLAVSHSLGDGTLGAGSVGRLAGPVESTLTSLYPYARVNVTDRVSAWGLGGFGAGNMSFPEAAALGSTDTGIGMLMAAVGARGSVVSLNWLGQGFDIAVKTDAFLVRMSSDAGYGFTSTAANANRLRLLVEAAADTVLASGGSLSSKLELGVRLDGGDAETGMGMEVGGGFAYADSARGFRVEATIRRMMVHQDDDFGEWGVGGSVIYQPLGPNEGLSLRMGSSWGVVQSGVQEMWSPHATGDWTGRGGRVTGPDTDRSRVTARMHYAFAPFGDGVSMAPYVDFMLAGDTRTRTSRVGWRFDVMEVLKLSLESGVPGTPSHGGPEGHGVTLRGSLRR